MTDLVARVVAAIQQVRTSTPHDAECIVLSQARFSGGGHEFGVACNCTWTERVDARLAACVEASWHVAIARCIENVATGDYVPPKKAPAIDAGLAAFLAAAAQKETTK